MKKFFTLITMTLISLVAMANDYTDKLTVTVNGVSSEQMATITVEKEENGLYTFSLKNFCLESTDDDGNATRIGVGNIVLSDREGSTADGVTTITFDGNITIAEGDDPEIGFWMGPMIGEVPIAMEARFNDEQLYCEIHIDLMATLEQMVEVTFGTEPEKAGVVKTYTDQLVVTVNGVSSEQEATINLKQASDGLYTFSLKNFCLESKDDDGNVSRIGVGNIVLPNLQGTAADGVNTIKFDGNITIAEGDDPNVAFWMGPMIGEVPIVMEARFNDEKLYCEIHIDLMATLEQMVEVTFGTDFNLGVELKKAETTAPAAFYTLGGQRISTPQRGQVVIERKSNGQTVKHVVNK